MFVYNVLITVILVQALPLQLVYLVIQEDSYIMLDVKHPVRMDILDQPL